MTTVVGGAGPRYEMKDGERIYTLYAGRESYWSVTTVLGIIAKYALIRWAAVRTATAAVTEHAWRDLPPQEAIAWLKKRPWEERDAAARRGLSIHQIAEHLVRGEEVAVEEALAGYVDAFRCFLADWSPEIVAAEITGYNRRLTVAGTADLILQVSGARMPCVVDSKTGKGVYAETQLQLTGYRFMEFYIDGDGVEQPWPQTSEYGAVLHLKGDGTYDFIPVRCGEEQYATFVAVRKLWAWHVGEAPHAIGPPLRR